MKNSSFMLCLLSFYLAVAQNKKVSVNLEFRAIYLFQHKMHLDSHNIYNDYMLLFVNKNGESVFLDRKLFLYDSIRKIRTIDVYEKFGISSQVKNIVTRVGNKLTHYEKLDQDLYQFEETIKHNWKFVDEKKTISGFTCKKAIVNYGGRSWTAWYAPTIASYTGPYKFYGLPGLIMEIYDADNNYHFTIDSLDTGSFTLNANVLSYFENFADAKLTKTLSTDFYKIRRNYFQTLKDKNTQNNPINVSDKSIIRSTRPKSVSSTYIYNYKERNFIEQNQ